MIESGKFQEAEATLRQSLEMQRKLLGREHPDVVSTLANLATSIHLQGRYAEAEALEREVLALARSQYGPEALAGGRGPVQSGVPPHGPGQEDRGDPLV